MDTASGSSKGDTARLEPGSNATKQVDPDARTAGRATATPTQSATSLTRNGLGAGSLAPGDSVPSLDRATRRDSTGEAAQRLRKARPLCDSQPARAVDKATACQLLATWAPALCFIRQWRAHQAPHGKPRLWRSWRCLPGWVRQEKKACVSVLSHQKQGVSIGGIGG
jgi:hypothetical protein